MQPVPKRCKKIPKKPLRLPRYDSAKQHDARLAPYTGLGVTATGLRGTPSCRGFARGWSFSVGHWLVVATEATGAGGGLLGVAAGPVDAVAVGNGVGTAGDTETAAAGARAHANGAAAGFQSARSHWCAPASFRTEFGSTQVSMIKVLTRSKIDANFGPEAT
jgi:hypothetical protein